jgi:zinc transport system substrate-binding protein
MKAKFIISLTLLLTLSLFSDACQRDTRKSHEGGEITVVTSLFPLYDFARNIGHGKAEVTLLLPPGMETHSFEPKPGDIVRINEANLFIYTGKFMEPWVEDVLSGLSNRPVIIDASKGIILSDRDSRGDRLKHHHAAPDPHIWLDFSNAQKMVDNILGGFISSDPEHEDFYRRNAEAFKKRLVELDRKFSESLASCRKDIFIHGGHFAFGYLAKRYHLNYLTAYREFSPDAEPTPNNLIELINKVKRNDVKYIFYEELITPRLSETIAKETGARLLLLHGAHNVTTDELGRGVTFMSLMEQNLKNLKTGLECE